MANVERQSYPGSLPLCVEALDKACETNTPGAQGCFNHFSLQQHKLIPRMPESAGDYSEANETTSLAIVGVEVYASEQNYISGHNATRTVGDSRDHPAGSTGHHGIAVQSDVSSGSGSGLTEAISKDIKWEAEPVSETFERLAERFSKIPDACFNNDFNKAAVEIVKVPEAEEKQLKDTGLGYSKLLLREFLTRCITGEIKQKDRKEQLMALKRRLEIDYSCNLMLDIQVLLHLKCFGDIIKGEHVSQSDRDSFLSFVSQEIIPFDDHGLPVISFDLYSKLDIISLQTLFYLGVLPGYFRYVNYPKAFKMLGYVRRMCERFIFCLSPVSFTIFDSFRYCSVSEKQIEVAVKENECLQKKYLLIVLLAIAAQTFSPKLEECNLNLDFLKDFNGDGFSAAGSIVQIVYRYHKLNFDIHKKEDEGVEAGNVCFEELAKDFECELVGSVNKAIKIDKFRRRDYKAFADYFRAALKLRVNPNPSNVVLEEVGDIYGQIADKYPMTSVDAYQIYKKISKWSKAAESAKKYSQFWKKDNRFLSEYWDDISIQMRALEKKENKEEEYDVNKIMEEFSEEGLVNPKKINARPCVAKKKKKKKKSKQSGQQTVDTLKTIADNSNNACLTVMVSDRTDDKSEINCTDVLHCSSGQYCSSDSSEPVVAGITPFNQDSRGQWLLVNKKKTRKGRSKGRKIAAADNIKVVAKGKNDILERLQSLYSSNWNPEIKNILQSMLEARDQSDLVKEQNAFDQLKRLKDKTGEERLWLERGWTELHKFDDVFKTGIMPQMLRESGSEWISKARDVYFFPVLARIIDLAGGKGVDIRDPGSVRGFLYTLRSQFERSASDQLGSDRDYNEVCFQLRGVLSSIGHTYSLSKMINSVSVQKHQEFATSWYGLKRMLPSRSF